MAKTDKARKERFARLQKMCDIINKNVKNAATSYIGSQEVELLKRFSSGIPSLDEALGGGWPLGRIVELYGAESSGKTSLCYHLIAEFQKAFPDEDVLWIDSEYSFDPEYAEKVGVEKEYVLFQQPECGEDAFNVIKYAIQAGVKLVIVDSVAALTPRAELEKEIGERTVGETARLMSSGLKQLVAETSKNDGLIVFTNQVRDKIGVTWGDKSTTPGGRALRFYSSIRVELKNMGTEKDGEVAVSSKVKAVCKKNKTAPPLRESLFNITYGIGVDPVADTFEYFIKFGIIDKSGAWFSIGGERLGQGKAACLEVLRTKPELFEQLQTKLAEAKASGKAPVVATETGKGFGKKPKTVSALADDEESEESGEDFSKPASNVEVESSEEEVEVSSV